MYVVVPFTTRGPQRRGLKSELLPSGNVAMIFRKRRLLPPVFTICQFAAYPVQTEKNVPTGYRQTFLFIVF